MRQKDELLTYFAVCDRGNIYRVDLRLQGPDARIALREKSELSFAEIEAPPFQARSMSKPILLAKQFNFVAQPGVLFGQLLTFSKKLAFARPLLALPSEQEACLSIKTASS